MARAKFESVEFGCGLKVLYNGSTLRAGPIDMRIKPDELLKSVRAIQKAWLTAQKIGADGIGAEGLYLDSKLNICAVTDSQIYVSLSGNKPENFTDLMSMVRRIKRAKKARKPCV